MELACAAVAVLIFLAFRGRPVHRIRVPGRDGWWMALLFVLPIALRLALLPQHPVPMPSGADDFGYVLLADTLKHFRLANPPHAFPDFFDQIFVLQRPTYSSMFNLGQGLVLTFGWLIFGHPWAGVLLASGVFCSLTYWMLRGWTTQGWALTGGLLAVMQFGPLSYWMNCYWGGTVSAIAGCLVFGSLPRVAASQYKRNAVLLGTGLAIQLLTRPFEFGLLAISTGLYPMRKSSWRKAAVALIPLGCAGGLVVLQNYAVTGNWTTLPYMLYRYQYGIPATFTFQPNPVPHLPLNPEKELDYKAETIVHGDGPETITNYFERFLFRIRFYRFFLLPPLYIAAIAFLLTITSYRRLWVLVTVLIFALGSNFYPYFYPHYIAAITCLLLLAVVGGLQRLQFASSPVLVLCAAHFVFWYSAQAMKSPLSTYESWDYINAGDPQGRIAIENQLQRTPGKQLVFVHYAPGHMFEEWIHNAADIDASKVVWVHDLGPAENANLKSYYPDRAAWLLMPDEQPPKLEAYRWQSGPFQDVH